MHSFFRSDTESAEETTAKDETDDKTNGNDEKKDDKKGGMVSRVTTYLSAMKNSMKKPKDIKYTAETPESEMKVKTEKGCVILSCNIAFNTYHFCTYKANVLDY